MNGFKILTGICLLTPALLGAQTAAEITQRSMDAVDFASMEMTATLKIYDAKGSERIRQISMAGKQFGEIHKLMIRFLSPADVRGTAILVYDHKNQDDDMWIYMPALRKTRRIVSSEKGKSFMGSEFTHADMSKPSMDDFRYQLLGRESYEGMNCWRVESACRDDIIEEENGFSKKVSIIQQDNYLCHKSMLYDAEGKLMKTQTIRQYKKQSNGRYFAFKMEMKNEQNGRKSTLTIDQFRTGSGLPESTFTPAMMEK